MLSPVCTISDPINEIKARIEESLSKMNDPPSRRRIRPLSATAIDPARNAISSKHPSRPSTAQSITRRPYTAIPRTVSTVQSDSHDLMKYARSRFNTAVQAEEELELAEEVDVPILGFIPPRSPSSVASRHTAVTSKTNLSAYVTMNSSRSAVSPAVTVQEQLSTSRARAKLLNDIRLTGGKQQEHRFQHDRVKHNFPLVKDEGRDESVTSNGVKEIEDSKVETEETCGTSKMNRRNFTRGPLTVSSIASVDRRRTDRQIRRVGRLVSQLKAEINERKKEEEQQRLEAERQAVSLLEERLHEAVQMTDSGPETPFVNETSAAVSSRPALLYPRSATQRQIEPEPQPLEVDDKPQESTSLEPEVHTEEVETANVDDGPDDEDDEEIDEDVLRENSEIYFPNYVCPSSEDKSREFAVRQWLRRTTGGKAPSFLSWY